MIIILTPSACTSKGQHQTVFWSCAFPGRLERHVEAVTSRQHPFLRHRRSTSLERLHPVPSACRALPSSGDYCQILSVKELFLLVNRRGRREWRLFPPPTDPKIIEIWLNLRFEKNILKLRIGKTYLWVRMVVLTKPANKKKAKLCDVIPILKILFS